MTTQLVNGLAVEVDGVGAPLLCIHGLGGSSNTWTPLLAALSQFTVIRPDLPGSARSELPESKLSIEVYVAAIEDLLSALGIEEVHVAAHSLGTIVAQHFTLRNAAKVKSLALFGPLAAPPEAARANIFARAQLARTGLVGMQQIADSVVIGATSKETKTEQPAVLALVRESVMRQSSEGYAQSCEALASAQPAVVEQIRVPTLLVTGDQDVVAPPGAVAVIANRIKNSQSVVYDGCGHWTTFEKSNRCSDQLESFHTSIR